MNKQLRLLFSIMLGGFLILMTSVSGIAEEKLGEDGKPILPGEELTDGKGEID